MRHLLLVFFAAAVLVSAQADDGKSGAKKGWGGSIETAETLKAHWYYNWWIHGASKPGVEFVPMVKGKVHATPQNLAAIKASGAKSILGFNEPERASQGNTTVEEALALWPKLMETGLRLGSPAPSSDGGGMAWLDRFMQGVASRKLRVDFLAVHWYRSSDPREFEAWLTGLHNKYHRPIWITEFDSQYSGGDRNRFASESFKMLDRLHFVERYAYFTTAPGTPGALFKKEPAHALTPLGEAYVRH